MPEVNDTTLVRECLGGNKKAFAGLIDRYQKVIFNAALRMVGDYHDAEDITQTVFIKAYESLDTFDPQHKFFSWIYRIMVNQTLNFISRQQPFTRLDDSMVARGKNPEQIYAANQRDEKIQAAVADLQLDYRIVIVLKHFIDLPYRDISFILDIPEKTVKSRLFSARQKLCGKLVERGIASYD